MKTDEERKTATPLKSDAHAVALQVGAPALAALRQDIVRKAKPGSRVVVNLSAFTTLTNLEAAALLELVLAGKDRDVEVRFSGLSDAAQQPFIGLDSTLLERASSATERLSPVEHVGEETLELVGTGKASGNDREIVHWLFIAPWRGKGIKWIAIK